MITSAPIPASSTYPLQAMDPPELSDTSSESSQAVAANPICVKISDFNELGWKEPLDAPLTYAQIVNYPEAKDWHHNMCAMCGQFHSRTCFIPRQNKDICRDCDCAVWVHQQTRAVLKFCKGCKNFVQLADFSDKPTAAKCSRCRERGRANYVAKKRVDTDRYTMPTTTDRRGDFGEMKRNVSNGSKFNNGAVGYDPTAACTTPPSMAGAGTTVNLSKAQFAHWQRKVAIDKHPISTNATSSTMAAAGNIYAQTPPAMYSTHMSKTPNCRIQLMNTHSAQTMNIQLRYLQATSPAAVAATTTKFNTQTVGSMQPDQLCSPASRPSPRTVTADFQFSPFSFQSPPFTRAANFSTSLDENSSVKKFTRQVNIDLNDVHTATHTTESVASSAIAHDVATKRPLEVQNQPLKKRVAHVTDFSKDYQHGKHETPDTRKPLKQMDVNVADAMAQTKQTAQADQKNRKESDDGWVDSNPLMQLANLIDVLSK